MSGPAQAVRRRDARSVQRGSGHSRSAVSAARHATSDCPSRSAAKDSVSHAEAQSEWSWHRVSSGPARFDAPLA